MDKFIEILNSTSVTLALATFLVIAFARCIVRIFKMGATWKTQFATIDEQHRFEEEMRKDMRGYAVQIQKTVMDSAVTIINSKLADIEGAKKAAEDTKEIKIKLEAELEKQNERYDELRGLSQRLNALSNTVARLDYGGTSQNQDEPNRRSEK